SAPENNRYRVRAQERNPRSVSWLPRRIAATPTRFRFTARACWSKRFMGWRRTKSNQCPGFRPTLFCGSSFAANRYSSKATRHLEGFALSHHVVTGACELVRERLEGDGCVGCRALSVEEAFGLGAVYLGMLCGLDERPGEILVAAFGVAFAFFLAVREPLA